MDASVENSITYHGSEKDFYAFTDKKNLTENFEKYLVQFLKTFTYVTTGRSKQIHSKGDKAIWDVHLPNPGISGKNAFRLLCVIEKSKKKVILVRLFCRNDLPYRGEGKRKGQQRWNDCIKEIKSEYF